MSDKKVKAPRTVEVKLLIPYGVLIIAAVAVVSLITGWNIRSENMNQVKAEAASMVSTMSKDQK